MAVVAEEKSAATVAATRVISKALETQLLYELIPRHNLCQAKDQAWIHAEITLHLRPKSRPESR